ncbi:MAG: carbon-nitrogen family hydrolase [Sedimentisphaerales bacterium]|nr:carbon-nitrogen family hydrolase [Sedimentisphaerales bacterium]
MNVVGCQHDIVWENKAATQEKVKALFMDVSIESGSLIVLPEMFDTGFSHNVTAIAEDGRALTFGFLSGLAREYDSYVLGGIVTKTVQNWGHNQAVLVGPDGQERTRYTKIHPFTYSGESVHFEPGSELCVFECGGFKVCPLICYDLRFPEVFRKALGQGVQMFVVIANWPGERQGHWSTLLQARAIENQAYVVGVNRCGRDPNHDYAGGSCIIDPRGEILARAGDSEMIITAQVDVNEVNEYRNQFPVLDDRKGI